MADTIDTSPTRNFERTQTPEYTPAKDPSMRKVILNDVIIVPEAQMTTDWAMRGYKTDIQGAKVPLEKLHQHNTQTDRRSEGNPPYREGYFQTHSGSIYRFRDIQGIWVVEDARSSQQYEIGNAVTIEVGQRFVSPKLINGKAELDTSSVTQILLADGGGAAAMATEGYSIETSNIPRMFRELKRNNPTQVQGK